METQSQSQWRGSMRTAKMVAEQIAERWGVDEVQNYDPQTNCFTYKKWLELGYQVRKGEKTIKSITFVPMSKETKDEKGETQKNEWKAARTVNLFYIRQVDKIKSEVKS